MTDQDTAASKISNAHLNRLRAGVLGANDGIVSVASIIVGVAGATNHRAAIFTAGVAGLVAGAFSMAVGEFVSVGSQRDTEEAYISKEKRLLRENPEEELQELADIYQAKGMSPKTAMNVARELTEHDVIKAHLDAELNIDEDDLNSPVQAALTSMIAFTLGGILPLLAVLSVDGRYSRIAVTVAAVFVALVITGYFSATSGGSSRIKAVKRVVLGGVLAMTATYLIGRVFGGIVQ